ncbi:Protein pim1 [Bienertia sinuspersici]
MVCHDKLFGVMSLKQGSKRSWSRYIKLFSKLPMNLNIINSASAATYISRVYWWSLSKTRPVGATYGEEEDEEDIRLIHTGGCIQFQCEFYLVWIFIVASSNLKKKPCRMFLFFAAYKLL